jgi:serine/threonine-protein kinase
MGIVWHARNEALGKDVAVKLLRSGKGDGEAAKRFFREARAAASIDHPAVVRVFDCGRTESGHPFIVMERLRGCTLAELIEERQVLPAIEVVRGALPIVDGLACAHERGVVHRDLKPENVFLSREAGQLFPKVLDFGIAKMPDSDPDLRVTRNDTIVGSPVYMAPEQARGFRDVDHRCDIWAICVVIYEAVTGRSPFEADTYNATLASVLVDEVPPFLEAAGEEGLWDVLSIGLRKERDERFQSMRALGDALARYLARHGVTNDVRGVPLSATWSLTSPAEPAAPRPGAAAVETRPAIHTVVDTLPSAGAARRRALSPRTSVALAAAGMTFAFAIVGHRFLQSGAAADGADAPSLVPVVAPLPAAVLPVVVGQSAAVAPGVEGPAAFAEVRDPLDVAAAEPLPARGERVDPKRSNGEGALVSVRVRHGRFALPARSDLKEPY